MDIKTGYDDLKASVDALVAEDASVVTAIKDLQAQVAAGTPVTGDQLETLAGLIKGVGSDLTAAIGPPPTPPPAI